MDARSRAEARDDSAQVACPLGTPMPASETLSNAALSLDYERAGAYALYAYDRLG